VSGLGSGVTVSQNLAKKTKKAGSHQRLPASAEFQFQARDSLNARWRIGEFSHGEIHKESANDRARTVSVRGVFAGERFSSRQRFPRAR
jgi:hypothetical protein